MTRRGVTSHNQVARAPLEIARSKVGQCATWLFLSAGSRARGGFFRRFLRGSRKHAGIFRVLTPTGRHGELGYIRRGDELIFRFEKKTRKKRQNAENNTAFLAFLPVLRRKTGKNQPGAALEHLKQRFCFGVRKLDYFNGAVELIFRGRREQKPEIPPCTQEPRRLLKEPSGTRAATAGRWVAGWRNPQIRT